ncbi:hypothetical protein HUA74_42900 [Myxococcus sp. CA051A]|uniref:Uncharacterized protein n=1 Tax=Myxococcus llanfairpwllgwyngyllgogerychwyrndrobwllllantysiliogogogochensis TaxID=2590453 RepID=A0A540WIV7_9BACT|nr:MULTISPECIES: hypothetical protein [Myxococcus]NTX08161.1 hypothetical protein [Myxococcus sp. CA040A]NTX13555.1 hypothetical protein [Myxococcus sp. CA056]NTX38851.1 hypothetical protein [Myxococcus sp. CA033]NTX55818.1 hypothetical protein [Myxococcus sp. CA039A]NTX67421.1 hypothetical protein [Myxococcus sp. CA051A]
MTQLPKKLQDHADALAAADERLTALDEDALLAAPVDISAMLRTGIELHEELTAQSRTLETRDCVVVTGDMDVETLVVKGPGGLLVLGDLKVGTAELHSIVLVLGNCHVADQIVGEGEPNTLTVLGEIQGGRCEMRKQFIMQFLGGGKLTSLKDSEGGAAELLELLSGAGSELEVDEVDA